MPAYNVKLTGGSRTAPTTPKSIITPTPVSTPPKPSDITSEPSTGTSIAETAFESLLESLRSELVVRNYSRKTIKNYLRVVTDFLKWHGCTPTAEDAPQIMQYNIFLKEQSKYSPRTINLYSAAISFFYRKVVKTGNITEQVPRMKIGKPLPKVYSEQQIALLISAIKSPLSNLKIP